MQVLVSIQGLVLVPEPYYNEAGYSRQVRICPHYRPASAWSTGSLQFVLCWFAWLGRGQR